MTDLQAKSEQLLAAIEREGVALELSAFLVRDEPIPFSDAVGGEFKPFRVGDSWGPPWSTTWFHLRGRVPPERSAQRVVAVLDIGFEGRHTGFTCEALAWRNGKPWRGVDPNHRWLPIDSSEVDFYLEAAAIATAVVAGPAEAPSMIALRRSSEPAFVFRQAELRIQDPAARKVALDFKVLHELMTSLPAGGSLSARCGSRPTATFRRARPLSVSSCWASASSCRSSASTPASCGFRMSSATPRPCPSSSRSLAANTS